MKKSRLNWATGFINASLNSAQALAIIWVIDQRLSQSDFAFWSLVLSFHVLMTFSDAGLASTLVARLKEMDPTLHLETILSVALLTAIIGCGILVLIHFFFVFYIKTLSFQVTNGIWVWVTYGVAAWCLLLSRVFQLGLVSLNLVYYSHILYSLYYLGSFAVVMTLPKPSLYQISMVILVCSSVLLLAHVTMLWRMYPQNRTALFELPLRKELQQNFRSGLRFQAAGILGYVLDPLTRIMLERVGGSAALAAFELVYRVTFGIRQLLSRPLIFVAGGGKIISSKDLSKLMPMISVTLIVYVVLAGVALLALKYLEFSLALTSNFVFSFSVIASGSLISIVGMMLHYVFLGMGQSDVILKAYQFQFLMAMAFYLSCFIFQIALYIYMIGFAVLLTLPTLWYVLYIRKEIS